MTKNKQIGARWIARSRDEMDVRPRRTSSEDRLLRAAIAAKAAIAGDDAATVRMDRDGIVVRSSGGGTATFGF